MDDRLQEIFNQALGGGDVYQGAVAEELSVIVKRYSEHHRHYHNLAHVTRLLALCDELEICHPDMVLASVYHDIIYRPGSSKNEEKSAAFARKSLGRLGVDLERINHVCEMILATADHLHPPDDPLIQVFLDLDMSILGAPREEYHAYAEGVRKEHSRVPGAIFKKHRHRFLEKILAAESIFHTELFYEKYEASARANIERELGL